MAKKNTPPTPDAQPAGSGAVVAEEYTGPGARAVTGEQVPGATTVPGPEEHAANQDTAELADTEGDAEVEKASGEPTVTYHGEFPRREVSVADWLRAGISDQPEIVWDKNNGWSVPQSSFSPFALQALRQDSEFKFSDGTD